MARALEGAAPAALVPVPASSEPPLRPAEESAAMPLAFYFGLIRRHGAAIATGSVMATIMAVLIAMALPKQYQSTAVLRVDPSGARTVGETDAGQGMSLPSDDRLITTEAREVTSPGVVMKTIESLRLFQVPEFAPAGLARDAQSVTAPQMNEVLAKVTAAAAVDQPLDTYLLRVSIRSRDPLLAAKVANDLLASLIQHDAETRAKALTGSTESMRSQLTNLSAEMERSQRDLVSYESSNDVLDADSKTNLMQSRLAQVGRDLGDARTQRMRLQAVYSSAKNGDLDALMASDQGRDLLPLYQRWQSDQRDLSRMAQVQGPNYPLYREQQALVAHDQQALLQQQQLIANSLQTQYASAAQFERLLSTELDSQKTRMDEFNLKSIRYNALKAAADNYQKLYVELQQHIQDAEVAANLQTESLRVVSPAQPNWKPIYPRPVLAGLLVFLIATAAGCGIALVAGSLNRTVAQPEEIEHWFGLAVVATLPLVASGSAGELAPLQFGGAMADDRRAGQSLVRHSQFREGVLTLHSSIQMKFEGLQVLCICSSMPAEGKSTLAANLASAYAGLGSNCVLVDADMRKSSMHRQFQIPNRRGLSNLLRGQSSLDEVLTPAPGMPNLSLITAGPAPSGPTELLHSGLPLLMEQLRARFAMVLVDCPPVLGFADSLVAASFADGVLLVVRAGKTERQFVAGALRQLRAGRAPLLGVVLNSVSAKLGSYYSYYSKPYGDEDADDD